jgi:ABC-2 type transport system ATP-binding protein
MGSIPRADVKFTTGYSGLRPGGDSGVLLCTHLLDDVDRLCTRIGIIDRGRTRCEGRLDQLLAGQAGGRLFRLRLETRPEDPTAVPAGVSLEGHDDSWWRIRIRSEARTTPTALWGELWQRGWRIQEIRSEAASLEEFYLSITGHHDPCVKEAA